MSCVMSSLLHQHVPQCGCSNGCCDIGDIDSHHHSAYSALGFQVWSSSGGYRSATFS